LFISIFYPIENSQIFFINTEDSIIGAIFGYASLWCINWIFLFITKKEGIGYGDFKLTAALGAWLGWQSLPMLLLISSILGIVYFSIFIRRRDQVFAFGPFLSLAGIVWLFVNY
jgi:leader peptidase (prepilin peptidase)/N-methyltransferase